MVMHKLTRLIVAIAMALSAGAAGAADGDWQCSTIGGRPVPARAVSGFLDRALQIYRSQLLGIVRSGERIYLMNSSDEGWGERVRLGLMELRMAEPDITAARRFRGAVAGTPDVEVPAGEFVCLAHARAGRHGVTLTGRGDMLLAPGRLVHLVDPQEPGIVVVVRAFGGGPLDFREILAMSGRSGIYAGLAGRRAQPAATAAERRPGDAIVIALGPAGRLGEIVVMPRAQDGGERIEEKPAITTAAIVPPIQAPVVALAPAPPAAGGPTARVVVPEVPVAATVMKPLPPEAPATVVIAVAEPVATVPPVEAPVVAPASAPSIAAEPPVRVARAELSAAPPPAKPLPPEAPAAVVIAVAEPVAVAAPIRISAAQAAARPAVGQSYEDYSKAMKTLMALRRSGSVLSVSEMTYVHPAVEDLRARR